MAYVNECSLRHTAIAAMSLDVLENFYCTLLGMSKYEEFIIADEYARNLTAGYSNRIEVRKLAFRKGGSIELIRYSRREERVPGSDMHEAAVRNQCLDRIFGPGQSHIAVGSVNIEEHIESCKSLGGILLSNITNFRCLESIYCLDPEGNMVEFVNLRR